MFTSIIRAAAPVALAITVTMGALAPAEAGKRERVRNAGIIGAIAGAAAVGLLATRPRARPAPRPVYVAPRPVYVAPRPVRGGGWAGHVARCYAAYRSYDEASDTYQPYGNQPRRRCTK